MVLEDARHFSPLAAVAYGGEAYPRYYFVNNDSSTDTQRDRRANLTQNHVHKLLGEDVAAGNDGAGAGAPTTMNTTTTTTTTTTPPPPTTTSTTATAAAAAAAAATENTTTPFTFTRPGIPLDRVIAYCTAKEYRQTWRFVQRTFVPRYFPQATTHQWDECVAIRVPRRDVRPTATTTTTTATAAAAAAGGEDATGQQASPGNDTNHPPPGADEPHPPQPQPQPTIREIFLMDYGVVVFWGWKSREEELEIMRLFKAIEVETMEEEDHEVEVLQCIYDAERTPKIYNDV